VRDGVHRSIAAIKLGLLVLMGTGIPRTKRFGFAVTSEIALPDGGPTLWAMWRPPR
jgi:hypothetical protein